MKKKTQQKPQIKIGKYIDPLSDFGFKRLFGSKPNKELLINFLNELFKGRKVITSLTYNKNERPGPRSKSRKTIFDLTCTGSDGEQFIIEVQWIRQQFFKDRAVYYSSRLIHDQAPQGSHWDYSLKEVYFIGLMDFALDDSPTKKYLHRVHLGYEDSGRVFYKKLGFTFIEIPKFTKTEKELKTGMDKWLFILKNLSQLQKIPVILNSRIFSRLFEIAAVSNLTKEEYMKYEKDLMASWDEYAIKQTLLKEGREEGRIEGKTEEIKNLITKMGLTDAQAADVAEVSLDFVKKVRRKLKK